ncbi:hypothetical protein E2C01_003052 [Portunus trituberculatus]|uniref:Uncharacterized protein n=1 Tax=Portunus trituberculatus TaxID=210409 RepID=A0A5B7CMZ3_PORTR|nr:hypothetical protein [Portunus trituberculatus]
MHIVSHALTWYASRASPVRHHEQRPQPPMQAARSVKAWREGLMDESVWPGSRDTYAIVTQQFHDYRTFSNENIGVIILVLLRWGACRQAIRETDCRECKARGSLSHRGRRRAGEGCKTKTHESCPGWRA